MGLGSSFSDAVSFASPVVDSIFPGIGSAAGYANSKGVFGFSDSGEDAPNTGLPPTAADAAKTEADKAALRRQRAAALLAGGHRANILTSPLGIPGGQQSSGESGSSQGRKTLLGM